MLVPRLSVSIEAEATEFSLGQASKALSVSKDIC